MKTLTLYTKSDCHLCEDALEMLRRVQVEIPFELEKLDITTDEQLHPRLPRSVAGPGHPLESLR